MENVITHLQYQTLVNAKKTNTYANHICNLPCKLGRTKTFKIKNSDMRIRLTCSQIGGFFTGEYCFILT